MALLTEIPYPSKPIIEFLARLLAGVKAEAPFSAQHPQWRYIIESIEGLAAAERAKALTGLLGVWPDMDRLFAEVFAISPRRNSWTRSEWTCDEVLTADFPDIEYTIDELVTEGGVTLVTAKAKEGKTWMLLQAAQAVAAGVPMFGPDGKAVKQGKVVYYHLEDGIRRIRNRLRKQNASMGMDIVFRRTLPPLDVEGIDELQKVIDEERPHLIIIDTLKAAISGKIDESKAADMAKVLQPLRLMAEQAGVSFLISHHHKKGALGDPRDDSRGSSAIAAAVDVVAGIYKIDDRRVLKIIGNDIEEKEYHIAFNDLVSYGWHIVGTVRETLLREAEAAIMDVLRESGEATAEEVGEHLGRKRQHVGEDLKKLYERCLIDRRNDPSKKGGIRYLYFCK